MTEERKKNSEIKKSRTSVKKTSPNKGSLFPVVAIGASAGGLEAISDLLQNLPPATEMAYVIIQHLAPDHDSILPELLERKTSMPVLKVTNQMLVKTDHVYVIPPNTFMTIKEDMLILTDREKGPDGVYHAIDYFMEALAANYQNRAIGIVLSGTASDGTTGLKSIKAGGGMTFAQDETAHFRGMPQSAIEAGYVDYILPPHRIARELTALRKVPYTVKDPSELILDNESDLRQIQLLLHKKYGVDFTQYKQTTIQRRILRRMALNRSENLAKYTRLLYDKSAEVDLLYQDLLINVTGFFREEAVFQYVSKKILPILLKNRKNPEHIRIWIPACATGEEAYSFAICLHEYLGTKSSTITFQIFATDLDAIAIDKARTGNYSRSVLQSMSPQRLKRFFIPTEGGYQVIKTIRDSCVFATHNLLKDPPFSRIDLISCQNVLIYIEANPQKKILQSFHYALKPSGYLILGKSETVGNSKDLFGHIDKDLKIYKKKDGESSLNFDFSLRNYPGVTPNYRERYPDNLDPAQEVDIEKEADKLLLARYVPACVLVNKDLHIIRFHGNTQNYLHPASGKASFLLIKMVRDELVFELRGLIHRAKKEGHTVKKDGIPYIVNEEIHEVNLEVVPIKSPQKEPSFLVFFKEGKSTGAKEKQEADSKERGVRKDAKGRRILILEQELLEAREHMKSMSEEFEATREELQSANEEVLSSNEELQSINEELETSKEELQSTNEELVTINEELYQRNRDLKESSEYREAIVDTIREPLVVLTPDLRVRTANKAFYQNFGLSPTETEGNFFFEAGNRQWNISGLKKQLAEILSKNISFENFEVIHTFPTLGRKHLLISAMRMGQQSDKKNKILLVIEDVTKRKYAEEELKKSLEINSTILNSINDIFISVDNDWHILYVNKKAEEFVDRVAQDVLQKNLWDVLTYYRGAEFESQLTRAMQTKTFREFEAYDDRLGQWFQHRIYPSKETLSIYSTNITDQISTLNQLKKSRERYQNFISKSTEGIWRIEILEPVSTALPVRQQVEFMTKHSRLEECNNAIATMHGFTNASEIVGLTLEAIMMRTPFYKSLLLKFIESGYSLHDAEIRIPKSDGTETYFLHSMVGIVEHNNLVRLWGTQRDITKQKQAELALHKIQEKLQLALSAGNVGVWVWNVEQDTLQWAKDAEWGYDLGDGAFSGNFEDWLAFVHPDDRQFVQQVFQRALVEKTDLKIEFRMHMHQSERVQWVLFQAQTTYDAAGKPIQMMGVNLDITDRKMIEKEKDEFIGIASHELKTPVSSIKAYTELLYQMLIDMDEGTTAMLVKKMDGQIDRLAVLIKDLLDVTKISEGQLQLRKEPIDMSRLIQEIVDDIQYSSPRHTILKQLEPVPVFTGDRDRLGQVLINLISNATKYSPAADQVVVSCSQIDSQLQVSVEDFGIGLSEEAQKLVFNRFYRVNDPSAYTFPGIGLGLYISAEIVKRHGGKIWVESTKHKGSKFYFSIPVQNPSS